MRQRKPLCCSECDCRIREGELYAVILGDICCKDCADDYMRNEIEERFNEIRLALSEVVGIAYYTEEE